MKKKLLYIFILVALVLLFLAQRRVISAWAYSFPAGFLSFYFWPINLIIDLIKKPKTAKNITTSILSNYLYGMMVLLSTGSTIVLEIEIIPVFIPTIFTIFAVANIVAGFVYYFFAIDEEKARLHFIMGLFYCRW
jgi:hypothetical protein